MTEISRTSQAVWFGDLRGGNGKLVSESGALNDQGYRFDTRFEESPGTNPEELIAAAHAGCFAMAFSGLLGKKGYQPEFVQVRAVCFLTPKPEGGFEITRMALDVHGSVEGLDENTFVELAHEADKTCPVSNLLRSGLKIEIEAALVNAYEPQNG